MQIETGTPQSASWQFTLELSELWQKQHPETESGFTPSFTRNIDERFENLIQKNSRFVIAPRDAIADQIMLNRPVRLATLLWSVYLVPIHIGGKKEAITLNNYRYWYVFDRSVIIPELLQALNKPYFAENLRTKYQERISTIETAEVTTDDLLDIENGQDGELLDNTIFEENLAEGDSEVFQLIPKHDDRDFQLSAQIAGLNEFETEVIQVDQQMIQEIVTEYREGILFYEMMGPIKHLKNSFEVPLSTTGFNQNIKDFLISVHPWIHPVYKSRAGLGTLEFSIALYVHKDEDSEFVEQIIKLLSGRLKSYFPTSHIFSNLSIQKTKDLSPLFMHAGSLKYFDLD